MNPIGYLFAGVLVAQLTAASERTTLASLRLQPRGSGQLVDVQVSRSEGQTVVTLSADSALPLPEAGAVEGPSRIFIDLAGIAPGSRRRVAVTDPLVRQVRIALHSSSPRVTRVVLDLTRNVSYQIDTNPREPSRLSIVLVDAGRAPQAVKPPAGASKTPPAMPTVPESRPREPSPAPAAPAPAQPAPTTPPGDVVARRPVPSPPPRERTPEASTPAPPSPAPAAPTPGASDARAKLPRKSERYLVQALDRLEALRPLLTSIDRRADVKAESLQAAATELESLRRALMALKPADSSRAVHDLVVQACTLAQIAVRQRLESPRGDIAALSNASSAAAGGILLLDRALADIGYTPGPSR